MTEKLPVLTTTELERCRFKESCSSGYGKLDDSTVNRLIAYVAEKQRDADLKVVERLEAEIAALRLQLLNEQRRGDTYWQIMRQDEGLMGGSMETNRLKRMGYEERRFQKWATERGYRSLESVRETIGQVPLRQFTEDEIVGLIPAQAIIDYDRAEDLLRAVQTAMRQSILKALG